MGKNESVPEDVKAKFRAALDRKHSHGGTDVSAEGDIGKVDHAQRQAKTQQMFRRKSG